MAGYIGTLEAVRARLEGNDFRYVPPFPSLEKLTQRDQERPDAVGPKGSGAHVREDFNSSSIANIGTDDDTGVSFHVPIYRFDVDGAYHEQAYASMTYEVIGFEPRYSDFVFGDGYCEEVQGTTEDVVDERGENLGPGARMIRQRPVEHPFDVMIEVRAYARDPTQTALLVAYVYDRFEPRGFLRVPQMDGTFRSWDMVYQSYQDLDKREVIASGSPGIEREYAKVWTYVVEGYLDNTDLAQLVHITQRRTITMERTSP